MHAAWIPRLHAWLAEFRQHPSGVSSDTIALWVSKLPPMFKKFFAEAMGALRGMPQGAASHLETISRHADAILGAPKQHLHEHYSPDLHIDLIHYAPTVDRDFHYLLTSGMSDRPMTDGGLAIGKPLMELILALPAHWDISAEGFKNPITFQPVKLLKQLARYPHANNTYFEKYHTVSIGDQPLLHPMQAIMLMPPVLVPEFREPLELPTGMSIQFMAIYLLHQDELDSKLAGDLDRLFEKFGEEEITEIYDIARPTVCH